MAQTQYDGSATPQGAASDLNMPMVNPTTGQNGSATPGYALSMPVPAGLVPDSWVRNDGPENEGSRSLASPGNSGVVPHYTENGTPHPIGVTQGNGVRMPPPMSGQTIYENSWGFNDDGEDMVGVSTTVPYRLGVQLPGPSIADHEAMWAYGVDYSNLAQHEQEPPTNQNFGVFEGDGVFNGGPTSGAFVLDGDDPDNGMHVVGRIPRDNYDGVQAGDILPAFGQLLPDGGQGTDKGSGMVPGPAMQGIPVSIHSGSYDGPYGVPTGMYGTNAQTQSNHPAMPETTTVSYPAWSADGHGEMTPVPVFTDGPRHLDGTRQGY